MDCGVNQANIILVFDRIRIENMEFPNTSLSLISGTGIKLLVENASAMALADWSVETWLL